MQGKGMMSTIAYWLLIVGGLNWGLVGLGEFFGANWNVVYLIFGGWPYVEAIVYVLVGISALMMIFGPAMGRRPEGGAM